MYWIQTIVFIAISVNVGALLTSNTIPRKSVLPNETVVIHHQERRALGDCGGTFTATSGQIASPGYPYEYSNNQQCRYYISTTAGQYIRLSFTMFETESSSDYVSVYDGSSSFSTLLGEYSGSNYPPTLYSTGSSMYIYFYADYSVTYDGFLAQYTTVSTIGEGTYDIGDCGGTLTSDTGAIASPNYPNNYLGDMRCTYYISLPSGYTVELEFSSLSLETCCDYLEIFDGSSTSSPSLGKYYTSPNQVITSSGPNMVVYFYSDSSINYSGFYATYRPGTGSTTYVCSDSLSDVTILGGIISSHHPDTIPSSTTCSRTIRKQGTFTRIYLKFTQIDMESIGGCGSNYVIVSDLYGVLGTQCDMSDVIEYTTNSGALTLSFTTGYHANSYDGFKAVFALYYTSIFGTCLDDNFLCSNDRCISAVLRCDGNNHCGDNSDENNCPSSSVSIGAIVGGVIGGLILLIIIIVIIACCCKKSSSTTPSTATNTTNVGSRRADMTVTYDPKVAGYTGGQTNPAYGQGQFQHPQSTMTYPPPPMQVGGPNPNVSYDPTYPPTYAAATGYSGAAYPPPPMNNIPGQDLEHTEGYPPPSMNVPGQELGITGAYPPPPMNNVPGPASYNDPAYPPPQMTPVAP